MKIMKADIRNGIRFFHIRFEKEHLLRMND